MRESAHNTSLMIYLDMNPVRYSHCLTSTAGKHGVSIYKYPKPTTLFELQRRAV